MTYAVTGSTGALGTLVVQHLLKLKVPASSIVALARDQAKAADLKSQGVQVRIADYTDPASVETALKGVDRLLLISGSEVGQRFTQHKAVVDAAKAAGVKFVAYTSLAHADTSTNPLAPEHRATEGYLKTAGVPFALLRHNWYTENHLDDVRYAKVSGVIAAPVGDGKIASASRADYAEGDARALMAGEAGRVYEFTGAAWDYKDLAKAAAEITGRPVVFQNLTAVERRKNLLAAGLPEGVADFVVSLDLAVAAGTLAAASPDLEKLLGRKPLSLLEGLRAE